MRLFSLLAGALAVGCLASCANKNVKTISVSEANPLGTAIVRPQKELNFIPKATAFRMSGDYADHVAVTLGENGKLAYYPEPRDISEASKPISLGDGWWLNRQGLGPNSVFLKYTFEEYSNLKNVPSQEEIMEAIIPGAKVTTFRALPIGMSEADKNIDKVREMVKGL